MIDEHPNNLKEYSDDFLDWDIIIRDLESTEPITLIDTEEKWIISELTEKNRCVIMERRLLKELNEYVWWIEIAALEGDAHRILVLDTTKDSEPPFEIASKFFYDFIKSTENASDRV